MAYFWFRKRLKHAAARYGVTSFPISTDIPTATIQKPSWHFFRVVSAGQYSSPRSFCMIRMHVDLENAGSLYIGVLTQHSRAPIRHALVLGASRLNSETHSGFFRSSLNMASTSLVPFSWSLLYA